MEVMGNDKNLCILVVTVSIHQKMCPFPLIRTATRHNSKQIQAFFYIFVYSYNY